MRTRKMVVSRIPALKSLLLAVAVLSAVFSTGAAWAQSEGVAAGDATVQIPTESAGPGLAPFSEEAPIPTKSLWDMVLAGGPLLIPILVGSFVLREIVVSESDIGDSRQHG